jgi:pSer/pThr/pTyr-binding forkhead associated (FHA) protein
MGKSRIASGRKLVVLSGRAKGTAFVLTEPEVKAGRENDNAICLKGKRVSRHHAILVRDNGEYTLRDMSPRIGTLLNGRRTKEAHLKVGDRIRIGEFEMVYEAATAPAIDAPFELTPAPIEEVIAPVMPVMPVVAEPKEPVVDLTQETERLIGEVKMGNEALESVRAQLQTQSDLQADLTARLKTVSGENVALVMRNRELQAKVSELKGSAEEADRVDAKLTQEIKRLAGEVKKANEAVESLRAQLQARSDQQAELTERLKTASQENAALTTLNSKLETKVSKLEASAAEARPSSPAAPAEAHGERDKVSDPPADIAPVVVESDEERMAAAKARKEAILAKDCVPDKTNEQFDRIRQSIVEKRSQNPETLLARFLRPFRATAGMPHNS